MLCMVQCLLYITDAQVIFPPAAFQFSQEVIRTNRLKQGLALSEGLFRLLPVTLVDVNLGQVAECDRVWKGSSDALLDLIALDEQVFGLVPLASLQMDIS